MGEQIEAFVGLDVAKAKHAVAIAEEGRTGEVRYFGEIGAEPASVRRMVAKLEKPGTRLHFCYEAGPIEDGPSPAIQGVVRWRLMDLCQWFWDEHRWSLPSRR